MNSLSWIIYAANVLPNIKSMLSALMFFTGLCVVVSFASMMAEREAKYLKHLFRWLFVTVMLGLTAAIIPSSETIYMIAASQAGELVVNTPEAQEVANDLYEILKQQLEELKGD